MSSAKFTLDLASEFPKTGVLSMVQQQVQCLEAQDGASRPRSGGRSRFSGRLSCEGRPECRRGPPLVAQQYLRRRLLGDLLKRVDASPPKEGLVVAGELFLGIAEPGCSNNVPAMRRIRLAVPGPGLGEVRCPCRKMHIKHLYVMLFP